MTRAIDDYTLDHLANWVYDRSGSMRPEQTLQDMVGWWQENPDIRDHRSWSEVCHMVDGLRYNNPS